MKHYNELTQEQRHLIPAFTFASENNAAFDKFLSLNMWNDCYIWLIKSIFDIIDVPFSTRLTKWLQKKEELGSYDTKTNLNLFNL